MPIDEVTRRNLELVESLRGTDASGTLLGVLDRTQTPMGARALRQWMLAPLTDPTAINARLDAVATLVADSGARGALRAALDGGRAVGGLAGEGAGARARPSRGEARTRSRRCRPPNGSARGSPRSRWATTRCSDTSSK